MKKGFYSLFLVSMMTGSKTTMREVMTTRENNFLPNH